MNKNLTLLFFSCLICLSLLEGSCRILGYGNLHIHPHATFAADPGFIEGAIKTTGHDFDWFLKLPPHLERDQNIQIGADQVSVAKAIGTHRVLFLGDSATYGVGVNSDQTFVSQLKKKLAANKLPNYELINAGVPGMSNVSEWLLYKSLRPLKPDTIVLTMFLANDINLNLIHGYLEPTLSENHKWLLRLTNQSAFLKFIYLKFIQDSIENSTRKKELDRTHHLETTNFRTKYSLNLRDYTEGEIATYIDPSPPLANQAYLRTKEILNSFKQESVKHGIRLLVQLIPTRSALTQQLDIQPSSRPAESIRIERKIPLPELNFDHPSHRILEFCKQLNLQCIDYTHLSRQAPDSEFLIPGDDHPSLAGHIMISNQLFKYFKK